MHRMKLIGCVWRWIPLFAMSLLGLGEVVAAVTRIEGLTYAQYGTRELQLDLFIPENHEQKMPAIVCIHGGGWWQGNRKSFHAVAATLAERGYVAAAISYRLSGEAPFPAAIQDCKAAVRWLRANAESYSINPRFIGAIGHSAGGHLAALLATSGGVADLEGEGGNARFSSSIQAAVPGGAQSDLETDRIRSMTAQSGAKIWHDFLGGSLDENEAN
ncbi:MAG: alpha/beta hydrolase [Verrucomicrobiae bacterium]|nr:alpha/beta hydrolase [Verrucomicrobiae bacterium]